MFHSFHFTIIFICYSVDPKLSEKHNFISIAISGGLAPFLSYFDWTNKPKFAGECSLKEPSTNPSTFSIFINYHLSKISL